jgi:hypothetical protein
LKEASAELEYAINIEGLSGHALERRRLEIKLAADTKRAAVAKEKNGKLAAARAAAAINIREAYHEVNVNNIAIDALFILAQHDGSKWAEEFRRIKDLCQATRAETGLWSAMTRVHYGPNKRTLLMYEAQHKRLERVQWLLARAAPRDAHDARGWTALYLASFHGYTDIVRALITAGAGVDIADNDGETPLYAASFNGHSVIVSALIAAGAGVNIRLKGLSGWSGWTPLYTASVFGHKDSVCALLAAGADVNIANNNGETPLFAASFKGHTDIVRALIAAGADVNIATARGRKPLDVAIHLTPCREIITKALIEAGATTGQNADDWSDADDNEEEEEG